MQKQLADLKQIFSKCGDIFANYRPREGQKRMAFEFVKQLNKESKTVTICEAGTGTGKSLAYLSSAIAYAINNDKQVVISTGTIALQRQLLKKDLPLVEKLYDKGFSYALAQGRGQYICLEKLAEAVGQGSSQSQLFAGDSSESQILEEMYVAYNNGNWSGERETFSGTIPNDVWSEVVCDRHKCQSRFEGHKDCPFHKARRALKGKTVILANHHLLLSDLSLTGGGGIILPSISEAVLVIDEAHDLPQIARATSEYIFSLSSFASFADSLVKAAKRHVGNEDNIQFKDLFNKVFDATRSCFECVDALKEHFQINHAEYFDNNDTYIMRSSCPKLDHFLGDALSAFKNLNGIVQKIIDEYDKILDGDDSLSTKQETIYSDYTFHSNWIGTATAVLTEMLSKDNFDVMAQWVDSGNNGYTLSVVSIEARDILRELLWKHTSDVLLCSATLSSVGTFDLFKLESGYPNSAKTFKVQSPFNYSKSNLCIPVLDVEPSDQEGYTQYLIDSLFDRYITDQAASLVLFSSYWQMKKVFEGVAHVAKQKGFTVQQQGESPKQVMLDKHSKLLKAGKKSVLFGTGSFSFGLDLAGDLLTNLIITKIPFASPTNVVELRHAEVVKSRGGNPFFELTLPQASRALVQGVGRLIRTEMDRGTVTILDSRLNTKRYGKQIIKTLPPFTRV